MTVDTSTAAITVRCQHLDHCAHDGKSEDAARMMALLAERDALRDQLAAARNEALDEVEAKTPKLYSVYGGDRTDPYAKGYCAGVENYLDIIRAIKSTTPAPRDGAITLQATPITFTYKNYRGEVATRTATPKAIWFGVTEWHPEPGWLMTAYDLEKAADRDFALADCSFALREVTVQEAARVLLDIARERYTENARTRVCQPVEPWDRISDDVKKMWLWASCIRALANEEQSDG
jgi:hypothetical protein